jgi:hypothetical protein
MSTQVVWAILDICIYLIIASGSLGIAKSITPIRLLFKIGTIEFLIPCLHVALLWIDFPFNKITGVCVSDGTPCTKTRISDDTASCNVDVSVWPDFPAWRKGEMPVWTSCTKHASQTTPRHAMSMSLFGLISGHD